MAMLHAEKARKERICWFNKDMEDRAHDDLTLEKLVEQGLEYDYFYDVSASVYDGWKNCSRF